MRIISGKMKGFNLYPPKNKDTRPLKDLARESIFNLLLHSKKINFDIKKSNVLDLYAGTGSFGLECLSRDSKSVCFVEKEKEAIQILKKNIDKLNVNQFIKILSGDVLKLIKKESNYNLKFDLIFCDPPFKNNNIEEICKLILNSKLLNKKGIIIIHRHKNTNDDFNNLLDVVDEKIYGISKIVFAKLLL